MYLEPDYVPCLGTIMDIRACWSHNQQRLSELHPSLPEKLVIAQMLRCGLFLDHQYAKLERHNTPDLEE